MPTQKTAKRARSAATPAGNRRTQRSHEQSENERTDSRRRSNRREPDEM